MIDSEIVALLHALKGARTATDQEVLDALEDAAHDHFWATTDIRCHRGIHFAAGSDSAIDIMIDAGVLVIASTDANLRASARASLEADFDRRLPRWREEIEVLELPHALPPPARPANEKAGAGPTPEDITAATAVITALLNRRYGDAAKMERRA